MKPTVAPKHTYGTLGSNVTVESGESIRVFKISFYNGTPIPQKFQIQYADGSATYADVSAGSGDTYVYDVQFLADFGVRIASVADADATVSIFHSGGGT